MPALILSLLLVTTLLGWALLRLARQRRATRSLLEAVRLRRTFLQEDLPEEVSRAWGDLCRETNDLIEENLRLQRQSRGQLTQFEATLGNLSEAVLIVDAENTIVLANQALQEIFPSTGNRLHQRLERVLHSVDFLQYVHAVREGTAAPQQAMEFADGRRAVWLEVTGTAIPALDGSPRPWALFVLHDITEQKKLEGVRKDFVANVSHELRTPLSIIKGYVETLVDGHHEMAEAERGKFLRTIQRHTERLNSLLEDLLTLSRLESINPGLRREGTPLNPLIAGIVDDYRARPAAAHHQIVFSLDPAVGEILLDPLKVTQVFENLLDNALKYTPPGSRIELSTRQHEEEVEVRVGDNGPGIPPEDLPHIFERFYRVDKGRSREKGGTGLGLSIVKHIVQLHGGRVAAESNLGDGTTFVFTLPVRTNRLSEDEVEPGIVKPGPA